mmetsp:Transcript_20705/g.40667  ORF Transcript_20705/g.40667 Transcript_20705/m.40667 type:complete len:119 (+) Transcript_20705:380-736(+)
MQCSAVQCRVQQSDGSIGLKRSWRLASWSRFRKLKGSWPAREPIDEEDPRRRLCLSRIWVASGASVFLEAMMNIIDDDSAFHDSGDPVLRMPAYLPTYLELSCLSIELDFRRVGDHEQ